MLEAPRKSNVDEVKLFLHLPRVSLNSYATHIKMTLCYTLVWWEARKIPFKCVLAQSAGAEEYTDCISAEE